MNKQNWSLSIPIGKPTKVETKLMPYTPTTLASHVDISSGVLCGAGLWDEIGYCESERLAFKPMLVTQEGFTEELLQQHTQEAASLHSKFETMKHILEVCCRAVAAGRRSSVLNIFEATALCLHCIGSFNSLTHPPCIACSRNRRKSKTAKALSREGSNLRPAPKTLADSGLGGPSKNDESSARGDTVFPQPTV